MSKKLAPTVFVGLFALSAFALASSASAQWMVNGTNLTGTAALAPGAPLDENVTINISGVSIVCTSSVELVSPQLEAGDKAPTNSLIFAGCSANGKCTVESNFKTVPLTATATLEGTLAINLIFKPKTKTVFGTLKFEGAECPLFGVQTATGTAKFLAPTGRDERLSQQIINNVTAASGELKAGISNIEMKGSSLLKLATDLPWSFL
ncbi:MAG TPA: hypothetical protein VGI76_10165 [Solirubrobacteraceae bacterium]|jgi:hypothetical protein